MRSLVVACLLVQRAVAWAGGRLVDLNEIVDQSPFMIDSAVAIDERGRIAAIGRLNGEQHTLLLVPQ